MTSDGQHHAQPAGQATQTGHGQTSAGGPGSGVLPGHELQIYPDSTDGFLFQYHAEFAADVDAFLKDASCACT